MHLLQAELAELRAAAAKAVRARAEAAAATTPAMLRRLGAKDLKTWCAAQGLAVTGLLKSELACVICGFDGGSPAQCFRFRCVESVWRSCTVTATAVCKSVCQSVRIFISTHTSAHVHVQTEIAVETAAENATLAANVSAFEQAAERFFLEHLGARQRRTPRDQGRGDMLIGTSRSLRTRVFAVCTRQDVCEKSVPRSGRG